MENNPGIIDTWTRPVARTDNAALLATEHKPMPAWESTPAKTRRPGDLFRHAETIPTEKVPLDSKNEPKKGTFGRW